jgi:K+/H+ antiporter YhaU regulatory subunit KhtT
MDSFQEEVHDIEEARRETVMAEIRQKYPWDVQVREIVLGEDSQLAGMKLRETQWRQRTGSMLVAIGREGHRVFDPGPGTPLFPGDRLFVLGEASELQAAEADLVAKRRDALHIGFRRGERALRYPPALRRARGGDGWEHAGRGRCALNRFGVTVVALQRDEERVTAPPPDLLLRAGDVIYVVGHPRTKLEGLADYCAKAGTPEETASTHRLARTSRSVETGLLGAYLPTGAGSEWSASSLTSAKG